MLGLALPTRSQQGPRVQSTKALHAGSGGLSGPKSLRKLERVPPYWEAGPGPRPAWHSGAAWNRKQTPLLLLPTASGWRGRKGGHTQINCTGQASWECSMEGSNGAEREGTMGGRPEPSWLLL